MEFQRELDGVFPEGGRMVRRRSLLLLAGVIGFATPVFASSQSLSPGTRVRVTAPSLLLDRQRGQLLTLGGDSLILRASDSDLGTRGTAPRQWVISRDAVAQLERSLGSRGHAGKGLLIGAGVGLAIGLVATDFGSSSSLCQGSGDYGTVCAMIVGASTAGGALLGALFGAVARSERWEAVPAAEFR